MGSREMDFFQMEGDQRMAGEEMEGGVRCIMHVQQLPTENVTLYTADMH